MTGLSRRSWIAAAAAVLVAHGPAIAAPAADRDRAAVAQVLTDSADRWSKGDLDGFMRSYEDSPRTVYIGGGQIITGFAAIRAYYAPRFAGPDPKLGQLSVDVTSAEQLGREHVLTTGRFRVARAMPDGSDATGIFTLLFHRTAAGWKIAYDHTS